MNKQYKGRTKQLDKQTKDEEKHLQKKEQKKRQMKSKQRTNRPMDIRNKMKEESKCKIKRQLQANIIINFEN